MKFLPYIACPHYGSGFSAPTVQALLTASFKAGPEDVQIQFECASLLACCFNRLWADCLNRRASLPPERRPSHFVMLHSDVGPAAGWLDTLHDEMGRVDADVLSCVIPIKDMRGLTSTGVINVATGQVRRFTLTEIHRFPETFDAAGCGHPDHPLAVNTGCWIARLDRPWVENFPGFTILDGIQKVGQTRIVAILSEDWHASRWWANNGVRVFATRKVPCVHVGQHHFWNSAPWGSWTVDKGDAALLQEAAGEIEGWMSHAEMDWLRERAGQRRVVVEVGCWHGRSTKALADACPGQVITVDHFQGSPDDHSFALADAASGAGSEARRAFHENLRAELASGKVRLLEMESTQAAASLNGDRADMVFLDGAHDTDSVRADIRAWLPKLRPGGLLCGHDANDARVAAALDAEIPGWKRAIDSLWEYQGV